MLSIFQMSDCVAKTQIDSTVYAFFCNYELWLLYYKINILSRAIKLTAKADIFANKEQMVVLKEICMLQRY